MLECLIPLGESALAVTGYPVIEGIDSWTLGAPFATPPAEQIVVRWDPETRGFKKSLYDATIPLMRRELIEALKAAGVDNLECFDARIDSPATGEQDTDYMAVNVVGAVAAADLAQSKFSDFSGRRRIDMDFDALVLRPHAPRGALLFRLAECTSGLVIHSRVKEHLESLGGFGLSFVEPADWIG